eukprot:7493159-Prorocentrum_lima.AAC.1
MTSSLVGSEMCIRDRASLVWDSADTLDKGDYNRRRRSQFVSAPAAVSYTHLTLPTICSV